MLNLADTGTDTDSLTSALAGVGDRRVAAAVAAAAWDGVLLPEMSILSKTSHPVVRLTAGTSRRLRDGVGPVHDGYALDMWESWPEQVNVFPPAPLEIVGFVGVGPAKRALGTVLPMRGLGAVMLVTNSIRPSQAAEADMRDVWLMVKDRLAVAGNPGPAASARRITMTRVVEELLFAAMLRVCHGTS